MSRTNKTQELKEILQNIIPNIFTSINGDPNWRNIENRMQSEYDKRFSNSKIASSYLEYNLYDLIYLATQKDDSNCFYILGLFDKIFQQVSAKLNREIRERVSKKIKDNILSLFNSDYIHFIGELAAFLIITSEEKYIVLNSEEKVPIAGNNKTVDWYIQDLESDEKYLIEVVNIHLNTSNRDKNLAKTIQKIKDKKTETLGEGNDLTNFSIFPIIWSVSSENIVHLSEDLAKSPTIGVDYHGPYTLYATRKKAGIIEDRFTHINEL